MGRAAGWISMLRDLGHAAAPWVLITGGLAACGASHPPPMLLDGGPGDAAPDTRTDVAPTVDEPAASPMMFSPCQTGMDCGTQWACLTAYPGGICTKYCDTDTDCGDQGVCAVGPVGASLTCLPRCTSGQNDCAPGSMCDSDDPARSYCIPACSVSVAGVPACPASVVCDVYEGLCTTASREFTGGGVGAPCQTAYDCLSGKCSPETATAVPSAGYLGGFCRVYVPEPPPDTFVIDGPLPQAGCPMGSVVYPFTGIPEGDIADCLPVCTSNADCRPGYMCYGPETSGAGAPYFSNGGCWRIDCDLHGVTCPEGTLCEPTVAGYATCVRDATMDGGVQVDAAVGGG